MFSLPRVLQASRIRPLSSTNPVTAILRTYTVHKTMSTSEEHPAKKQKIETKVCAAQEWSPFLLDRMASSVVGG